MLKKIITGSLRQRLLTPTGVILALCIIGLSVLLIVVQQGQLNQLRDAVLSSIKMSNDETRDAFATMDEQVNVSLRHMSETACTSIANATREGLHQQKDSLGRDLENALRENANSIADLLAQVAPRAILANDFLELINFSKSASGNPDIVYAVFLKPDGDPLTRYLDRQNPDVREYIKNGNGNSSIEKAIDGSRKDKAVFFVEKTVAIEGQDLGKILLCVSKRSSMDKLKEMEVSFSSLIDSNKREVESVIDSESGKVTRKMQDMIRELDSKNVTAAKAIGDTMNKSCDTIKSKTKQISAGVGGASIAAVFVILFLVVTKISKRINHLVSDLHVSARDVATSSGQISSTSESLAEWASQQASSIEETSASLEEMSAMTKQNAQDAVEVNSLMKKARTIIGNANCSMQQLTSSMKDISAASEKTQKIVKTIDEIAFQTNLLALNAAVEAARAGEAGAGFSVVANEVRNLAGRAAGAARSTAELIEGTVRLVNDGSSIVERTNKEFSEVETSTIDVGELIDSISRGSNENAQGIQQLTDTAAEMDKVTQKTAASAEESAAASLDMFSQTEQMRKVVDELVALVSGSGTQWQKDEGEVSSEQRAWDESDRAFSLKSGDIFEQDCSNSDGEGIRGSQPYKAEDDPVLKNSGSNEDPRCECS
ncbi:MAG: hypothetical protein JW941_06460 [Candidatus Coatesbacteria bacterium]|nr:hypothetical protein [Candidatus Coatesbacteria bacterium]